MRKFLHDNKQGILVGVGTSALWGLVQWIVSNLPKTGKTIFSSIQDLIYSSSAKISSDSILLLLFEALLVFASSISVITLVFKISYNKRESAYKKVEESLKKTEHKIAHGEDLSECQKQLEETENHYNKIEKYIAKDKKRSESVLLSVISFIFITAWVVISILSIFIPMVLLNKFNHDIQMIKPYTDHMTIMTIESDWTIMNDKSDYDKIYDVINSIKAENGLP